MGAFICLTCEDAHTYIHIFTCEFSLKSGKCCVGQGMGDQPLAGSTASIAYSLFVGKLLRTTWWLQPGEPGQSSLQPWDFSGAEQRDRL